MCGFRDKHKRTMRVGLLALGVVIGVHTAPRPLWAGEVDQVRDIKYEQVTPAEAQAAMREAKQTAAADLYRIGAQMRLLETPHFLIFTDWSPADNDFLMTSLEQAYRLVSREFGIPYEQNVFIGKLPVYMFDDHEMFLRYARVIDGQTDFSPSVAGYYKGSTDGMGKLAMSKPRDTQDEGLAIARRKWARTLTHEFVHAFLARYQSSAFVPRWLNEGLAEMIAETVYPRQGALEIARRVARGTQSIATIFDDEQYPPAKMYPVMMTLVQALYREDPKRFVEYIDRIKAGQDAQAALMGLYGVNYQGLEEAWRALMRRS